MYCLCGRIVCVLFVWEGRVCIVCVGGSCVLFVWEGRVCIVCVGGSCVKEVDMS